MENGFVSFFSVKLGVVGRLLSTGLLPALASPPPPKEVAMEDDGRRGVFGRDDGIEVKLGLKREMKSGRLTVENPEDWKGADLGVLGGRAERLSRSFSCFKAMSCLRLILFCNPTLRNPSSGPPIDVEDSRNRVGCGFLGTMVHMSSQLSLYRFRPLA